MKRYKDWPPPEYKYRAAEPASIEIAIEALDGIFDVVDNGVVVFPGQGRLIFMLHDPYDPVRVEVEWTEDPSDCGGQSH